MRDLREWAEDHGYSSYTCHNCGARFYDDSDPECPDCGPEGDGDSEPPHPFNCICADCAQAELTTDND